MSKTTEAPIDLTSVVAKATTGTGATIAAVGGLTLTEWMGVLGVVIALAGFVANWMHNRKVRQLAEREDHRKTEEHQMRKEEHALRIEALKRGDVERRQRDEPVDVERRRG